MLLPQVRSGNFAIPEAGHTVVLGGGAKLAHVLRSILDARERHGGTSFPGCLAVLSPQPKVCGRLDMHGWLHACMCAGCKLKQPAAITVHVHMCS